MLRTFFSPPDQFVVQWADPTPATADLAVRVELSTNGLVWSPHVEAKNTYCCAIPLKPHEYVRIIINGEVVHTDRIHAAALPQKDRLRISELVRQQRLKEKAGGVPGWLLKRRTGDRCPSCSHGSTQCTVCLGTGVVGGYYPAVPYHLANYNPTLYKDSGLKSVGKFNTKATQTTGVYGPVLDPGDVWVNRFTGDRYAISDLVEKTYRGVPYLYSNIVMGRLSPNHVLYKVLIRDDASEQAEKSIGSLPFNWDKVLGWTGG